MKPAFISPSMRDRRFWDKLDIAEVEKKYGAKYVCEVPGKTRNGWSEYGPIALFYQPNPPAPFTNHYFGILYDFARSTWMICDADHVIGHDFQAAHTSDGVIFSTFRHDFREVDGVFVDGGWDYFRCGCGSATELTSTHLRIVDGVVMELDHGDLAFDQKPEEDIDAPLNHPVA